MKHLIVISNHPPEKWSEAQLEEWEIISHIPFPNVPPLLPAEEVQKMVPPLWEQVENYTEDGEIPCLSIQGEATLVHMFLKDWRMSDFYQIVFPTTARTSVEKVVNGKTIKTNVFEFVQWRRV